MHAFQFAETSVCLSPLIRRVLSRRRITSFSWVVRSDRYFVYFGVMELSTVKRVVAGGPAL